jgi:hypothetical protein
MITIKPAGHLQWSIWFTNKCLGFVKRNGRAKYHTRFGNDAPWSLKTFKFLGEAAVAIAKGKDPWEAIKSNESTSIVPDANAQLLLGSL